MVELRGVGRGFCATNGLDLSFREFLDKKSLTVSALEACVLLD